jgi:hypothetical protein
MTPMDRREAIRIVSGAVGALAVLGAADVAAAPALGTAAPDFTLPGTTGDVSLKQYRGQKLVLLEFFGAAFAPT